MTVYLVLEPNDYLRGKENNHNCLGLNILPHIQEPKKGRRGGGGNQMTSFCLENIGNFRISHIQKKLVLWSLLMDV